MEKILSLSHRQGADTGNQEHHTGSSSHDELQNFNTQYMFPIIGKKQSKQDIFDDINVCLKNGADVTESTALDIAAQKKYQTVVEFDCERGGTRGVAGPEQRGAEVAKDAGHIASSDHPRQPRAPNTSKDPRVHEDNTNPPETYKRYLCVDGHLTFDHKEWIETLNEETTVKEKENIDKHLKLDVYPSDDILALFALRAYWDNPGDEHKSPELPEGWKLLTTARNTRCCNGYFGAAFWCPALQQVIVAHRGTKPTNPGALWADLRSIACNKITRHLCSAVTFTEAIATALNGVKREGVNFQLSITGHSLGGWLAQVTAFTVKYVQKNGLVFIKMRKDINDGFHAHTVVFESPGCKKMLSKMEKKFDFRLKKTIDLNNMDITSYLSAVNCINSVNTHVGTVYRVLTNLSDLEACCAMTCSYISNTHSIKRMYEAMKNNSITIEMLDWPHCFFHRLNTDHKKIYHEQTENYNYDRNVQKYFCYLKIFSDDERDFLNSWKNLIDSKINLTRLIKIDGLTVSDLFKDFEIKNEIITCSSEESIKKLIRQTKALVRWIPSEVGRKLVPSTVLAMMRAESETFLTSLKRSQENFRDTVGLETFLTSGNNILVIRTPDSATEMARLANIFHQIKETQKGATVYTDDNHYTFVDLKLIKKIESAYNITGLFQLCFKEGHLLFIQCMDIFDKNLQNILNEMLTNLKNNPKNKLVFVESNRTGFEDPLNIGNNLVLKRTPEIKLSDLTDQALEIIFDKEIILLQGDKLSLREIAGEYRHLTADQLNHLSESIKPQMLKNLLYSDIKMNEVFWCHDLNVHSTVNKEVTVARFKQASSDCPNALLIVSGIGPEELGTDLWKQLVRSRGEGSEGENVIVTSDGEAMFKKKCREEPHATIYWFSVSAGVIRCKIIYKNDFYIKRKFAISKYIFDFVKFSHQTNEDAKMIQNSIFVFLNVNDKQSLMSRYSIPEEEKKKILKSDHIKMAASNEEADNIIKKNPDRPVHILKQKANGGSILWQRSRGSLEGLRPYVTAEIDELVDEGDLCDKNQKVVIIADEPGMGKSTTLTSVSRLLRSAWLIRVDLKDLPFDNLPSNLCLNSVCRFILRDRDDWLRGLLQFCLDKENEHSREIYIFFDGFDEIKRNPYRNAEGEVLRLLEYLNNETTAKVWITTRLYKAEILENALSTFAVRFVRITEMEQREFLLKFWCSHLLLEVDNFGDAEKRKLGECTEYVYEKAKKVLGDDIQHFMGIPLQMRMLAEVCLLWVKNNVESETDIEKIFNVTSVLDLYQRFGRLKYDIYFSDKTRLNERMSDILQNSNSEQITEKHRMLSLQTLFPEFAQQHFDGLEDEWGAELCRVGLVQADGGGRGDVEFIHRTLAEFYCADMVVEWLRKRGRYHGHAPMIELLLTEILLRDSHRVIRIFIDDLVLPELLCEEAIKFCALRMSELWRDKKHYLFNKNTQTPLHVAVEEGGTGIVDMLVAAFRCASEQLIGFLAAHDRDGRTALGRAARAGRSDILRKIVGSVERCSYDVILELLLATYVTYSSLPKHEIKLLNNYLQGSADCFEIKNSFSRTGNIIQEYIPSFLAAVEAGTADRVGELCHNVKNGTEMLYMLLGKRVGLWGGDTALHDLARAPRDEKRTNILAHISRTLRNQNISAVGRAYGRVGQTPLHIAALAGHLDLVEWLINHGVWVDSPEKSGEETALFRVVRAGNLPVAQYLIEKGADINIINSKGENSLFEASRGGSLPVVRYLIERGVDTDILNNKGENLLFAAAYGGNLLLLQYLEGKGLSVNILNSKGENLLFEAARGGSLPLLQYLIQDNRLNINIKGRGILRYARDSRIRDFLEEQMAQWSRLPLGEESTRHECEEANTVS